MSAAAAAEAPPSPKGKKKLIIIIAAVLVLVLVGGGVGFMMMSKKDPDAEEGADAKAKPKAKAAAPKQDPNAPPVFVPLDPFTVNLADRDAERFAQVGVTLEFTDPKMPDQVKLFMPAIRNNILMALADRTAADLLARNGKEKLARRIGNETARALGFDVEDEEEDESETKEEAGEGKAAAPKKKKKKKKVSDSPVKAVYFSNFIVQ